MTETIIPSPYAKTYRTTKALSHPQSIRFYPYAPGLAMLQIRTYGTITDQGRTKYTAFSDATLDLGKAAILRDALDQWIESQKK